ncbi:hypothetical protein [Bradyrhizobium sp. 18]|uniref:hypothetical protein n=1 Tax=Bradyrhizobium sp. 18 TaxID=2782657 RepID=UPI001FFB1127|nr:hypothetical protein [Bradyrhizobium sp. 18]MCK1504568.1 hypothetical protein [Bradyrhizobium sp. 18]
MQIVPLADVLTPKGLGLPQLHALTPTIDSYKTLLFQPDGELLVSAVGIQHKDRDRAAIQFSRFLENAHATQTDLAICPEYSMPWQVLTDALNGGVTPTSGALWVLGCESITYGQLTEIEQALAPAIFIKEALPEVANRFLSSLVYVFSAPVTGTGETQLVVLAQFKTFPMSHPTNFEVTNLQRGTAVYRLTRPEQSVSLVSIICSDALDFTDQNATEIYDRCLIIHIQLNKDPRHVEFRRYRDKLLHFYDDQTELICLNWASGIVSWNDNKREEWRNVAGSAWYTKTSKFDLTEDALGRNHRKGLYYTWLKPLQFHVTFFNYVSAVFDVEASKVFHHAVAGVASRRRGPQLNSVRTWNAETRNWVDVDTTDDAFSSIISEAGPAAANLTASWRSCPFGAERVLALTSGATSPGPNWYKLQELDSCKIEDDEIIMRMTFCQDTNNSARQFKTARFRRYRELHNILSIGDLPQSINDLRAGFQLEWSAARPQQNVKSVAGAYATAIYMGDGASKNEIDAAFEKAADNMRFAFRSADDILAAQQRLVVWYREDGTLKQVDPDRFIKFDKTGEAPLDIGRSEA